MARVSVYECDEYREGFEFLFARERLLKGGAWSLAILAKGARLQPSYVTNVLKGRAHFSADQIYAIAKQLALPLEEADFLHLLLQHERTDLPERKKRLASDVEKVRQQHLRAEKVLLAADSRLDGEARERYYLDPHVELLHVYVGLKGAPTKTAEIAAEWGLSLDYVAEILAFLQREKYLSRQRGKWVREPVHQLLSRESPLTRPSLQLKRLKAFEAMQKLPEGAGYSFSATVTMSEKAKARIQAQFLGFLRFCEKTVRESEPEAMYQLQFDLFPWTSSK